LALVKAVPPSLPELRRPCFFPMCGVDVDLILKTIAVSKSIGREGRNPMLLSFPNIKVLKYH